MFRLVASTSLLPILQEEQERRIQEAHVLEAKRLQVLEKLASSVPYAEACANAEAKLDHITGDKTMYSEIQEIGKLQQRII